MNIGKRGEILREEDEYWEKRRTIGSTLGILGEEDESNTRRRLRNIGNRKK